MTTFPNSPRLQKGVLVGMDPVAPLASVIVFQYNPETVTRTLSPRSTGAGDGGSASAGGTLRLAGPPEESVQLEVVVDATDQLERGLPPATQVGIHPQLAALEMLLYPKSPLVIANEALLMAGMLEIVPPEAPLTILVWGPTRVVPVRLTEFSITEEMFDPHLNPIRAKVSLGLRVSSYHELGLLSPRQ